MFVVSEAPLYNFARVDRIFLGVDFNFLKIDSNFVGVGSNLLGVESSFLESDPNFMGADPSCRVDYRGTSLIRKHPPHQGPPRTLRIGIRWGPRGVRFVVREVPLCTFMRVDTIFWGVDSNFLEIDPNVVAVD